MDRVNIPELFWDMLGDLAKSPDGSVRTQTCAGSLPCTSACPLVQWSALCVFFIVNRFLNPLTTYHQTWVSLFFFKRGHVPDQQEQLWHGTWLWYFMDYISIYPSAPKTTVYQKSKIKNQKNQNNFGMCMALNKNPHARFTPL
jgi:hypothetical protein